MKNFLTPVCLALSLASAFAQTNVPNPSFETWSTFGTSPTDYEDPTAWKSTNGTVAFNAQPVNKSTDSHTGTYAAEIKVTSVFGSIVPVTLTNGDVPNDFTDYQINYEKAGTAVSIKPNSVSGYYKFTPDAASFDSAYAVVILKKWNGSTSDTVGLGSLTFAPASSYTAFNIPVTYTSTDMPDSIVVAFFNKATQDPSFSPTGKLLIDDISLDTVATSSGSMTTISSVSVYPNPITHRAYVTAEGIASLSECAFSVYNMLGTEVQRFNPEANTFMFHRNDLPAGSYFFKLTRGSELIASGKLFIN
jgi:hypothetical protein